VSRQFVLELNYLLVELYPVVMQESHPFLKVLMDDQQEYLCAAHTPVNKRVRHERAHREPLRQTTTHIRS